MKKILGLILSIVFILFFTNRAFGYVYIPIDGVEISSINSIETPTSDLFGDYKAIEEKIETSSEARYTNYIFIYEASKDAAISSMDVSEMYDLNSINPDNTSLKFTKRKIERIDSTYEEVIFDKLACEFDVSLEAKIGKNIFGVSSQMEYAVKSNFEKLTRSFTNVTVENQLETTVEYGIEEKGFYKVQKRRVYDVYYVVYATEVFDCIYKNKMYIRTSNIPYKSYILNSGIVYLSKETEFEGLYKFNYNSGSFELDTSKLTHVSDLLYI